MHELWLEVEHPARTLDVILVRRGVDGMIRCRSIRWCRACAATPDLLQISSHLLVPPIASDDDEILAMSGDEIRIGTGIQKETDRVDMTFPYREVKRLAIARQLRVALEQLLKRCRITRARGADRFPQVAPSAGPRFIGTFGCEFVRSDQVEIVNVRYLTGDSLLQRAPSGDAMFERKRVLNIAQGELPSGLGKTPQQTRSCSAVAGAQRFEPALRFLLQIVEAACRGELTDVLGHGNLLSVMPGVR
jgi:hypothetical protein